MENLKRRDEVSKRNRLVRLPLVVGVHVVNKNDKVLVVALVVDLGLDSLAASHLDGVVVVVLLLCVTKGRVMRRLMELFSLRGKRG